MIGRCMKRLGFKGKMMRQNDPFCGKLRLGVFSSIRKLMRAAQRGSLPAEYLRAMKDASSERALMRHAWYRKKKQAEANA